MSENQLILQHIQNTISEEFIKGQMTGVCLPSAILFYEEARKRGIKTEICYGLITFKNKFLAAHVWNVFDDQIYDPTIKIITHFSNIVVDKFNWTYTVTDNTPEEEIKLMVKAFKTTTSSREYFSLAPVQLQKIKKNIEERLKTC